MSTAPFRAVTVPRDDVVQEARDMFHATYANTPARFGEGLHGGACLYWTTSVIEAAQRVAGVRLVMQAGSAQFRRLPPHLDDGKPETATHFSYMWSPPVRSNASSWLNVYTHPDGSTMQARPDGLIERPGADGKPFVCLPEMHVWAADPERQELVDLSTKFLPTLCQKTLGVPGGPRVWQDATPPDYVWCTYDKLPPDWRYAPDRDATILAHRLAAAQGLL